MRAPQFQASDQGVNVDPVLDAIFTRPRYLPVLKSSIGLSVKSPKVL